MNAQTYIRNYYGDFPRWARALSGLRYREGLTQKELGALVGIDQAVISKMERGKREISKKTAVKLGKFFKTDYKIFL